MRRVLIIPVIVFLFYLCAPAVCLAQYTISGKVVNNDDAKPVANANVFLNNATTGTKTTTDGTFTLTNVRPGRYDLIVSDIAFETYSIRIDITNANLKLPDITLKAKMIGLQEVVIKAKTDPDRKRNLEWFSGEFLGPAFASGKCKILNPEVIDLQYDEGKKTLSASSYDFIEIENDVLGYRIKYLLKDFSLQMLGADKKRVHYMGAVLFEDLRGSESLEKRWRANRLEAYQNSPMHFLRAALNNKLNEEGFKVQQLAIVPNPERPDDNVIDSRIHYYEAIKSPGQHQRDSLSYWRKKWKLEKTVQKLMPFPLEKRDIIVATNKPGEYALSCDNDGLYIGFNKTHHFQANDNLNYLNSTNNSDNTLLMFNSPQVLFDDNGVIADPYGVLYYGVWSKKRLADLLPVDYQPATVSYEPITENNMISAKLDSFQTAHAVEKAYLHFDKPYYTAGDTMYFKSYVTLGDRHLLSDLSGILHVELINPNNKIERAIKLQLLNGVAWGDFVLQDTLAAGNYHVRAYTRWMLNADNIFEQLIPVGSLQTQKIPEHSTVKAVAAKPDLQFFPEGGQLVNGVAAKVAFKSIGMNGLGLGVKGIITDNSGKIVDHFSAAHAGMGYFSFTPHAGETYKANVAFADGSKDILDLPAAVSKGISLSVNNDSIPKADIWINTNPAYFAENKGKGYTLLIYSGGDAITVPIKLDSAAMHIIVLKRHLHTGIATITLFSGTNEPLCERLIFVQNYDRLNLGVASDKGSYHAREKVNFKLNAKTRSDSASMGHFSVSVINENIVPVDETTENTILSNLLLTSDLKGTVEQPNYYFTNITDEKLKELDLVMLTHGYRHFEWKKLLSDGYPAPKWQPEKSIQISGNIKSLAGKPIPKAPVALLSFDPESLTTILADNSGTFVFDTLAFRDSIRFVLQAVNAKGKNRTKISYTPDVKAPMPAYPMLNNDTIPVSYISNSEKQQEELNRLGLGRGKMLKEVKIKDRRVDDQYETQSLAGAGHADQVMHAKEIGMIQGPLGISLVGRLRGVRFLGAFPNIVPSLEGGLFGRPMLVVLDGMEGADINSVNASEVETVEVLKFSGAIYGMAGANGVIIITTKRGAGTDWKDVTATGILPVTVQGYEKVREFYSPKYESTVTNNHPDLRSTIYWKPELTTDKDGNASFDFYNADGTGTYRVVIEGIDEKGNIGRQIYRYKVD
ncbi:MAG TPA: DUF2012 domain-containing protein [Mucilaginibacter sp.]